MSVLHLFCSSLRGLGFGLAEITFCSWKNTGCHSSLLLLLTHKRWGLRMGMIGGVSRAGLMHKRTKHLLRAPSMRADSHCLKMWESPLTVEPLQQQSIIRTPAPQGALSYWCHCETQGIYRCLVCVVVLFIKVSGDHLEEAFHTCAVEVEVQSLL